jgi:MoxR-like ATPase
LRENAPEIIDEKKVLRDTLNAEIKESMERETANLVALRNTYKLFNESKDDLFCFTQMFNAVQNDIKEQFDNTANIIKTIKKASEVIATLPSNMLKTPNLVGKPQNKPQAPQATQPSNAEK